MDDLKSLEGIGALMEAARTEADTYAKPVITEIAEPGTGVTSLVLLSNDSDSGAKLTPINPSVFDGYRIQPVRRKGTSTMLSLDSFIALTNRFKGEDSAVFAIDDRTAPSIKAVFDYHPESPHATHADFGVHRTVYAFPLSDEWKAWNEGNKKAMSMSDFAHFLEDRLPEVVTLGKIGDLSEAAQTFVNAAGGISTVATPTRLIELSRSLSIYEKAAVEEVVNLSSGEGGIRFNAEHTDGDGKPVKVPSVFVITVPVFRAGVSYRIVCRLRYRKQPTGLVFWYEMWRADRAFDDAFTEAVARVASETALPVFTGKPE